MQGACHADRQLAPRSPHLTKPISIPRRTSRQFRSASARRTEQALREAEHRYQSLFENAVEGVFQTTPDGRILLANPALARMLGYDSPAELVAKVTDIAEELYLDPSRRSEFEQRIEADGTVHAFETQLRRRDGSVIWVSENARAVRDDAGRLLYYEGTVEDVTARRNAEEALRESEERYALALRAASDGLWDWNLETGRVHYSPRWKSMLGFRDEEIGDRIDEWLTRLHPDDDERVRRELEEHLGGRSTHFESEFRIRHRDGSWRSVLSRGLAVFDPTERPLRMAGSQSDITKRKVAEERLLHDAFHDPLTGLPNRALFTDRVGRSFWRARRRDDYRFAVAILDLDRLKLINDSLGHVAGDRLILTIARRIEECLRAGDSAARVGGDEFAVLIDDLKDPSDAIRVVSRIARAIRTPLTLGGQEVYTTASIGIAYHGTHYERSEEMIRDADTAMYAAKAAGGARYQIFDAAMHERAVSRLRTESSLRRAVERSELRAHYQPLVSLADGRLAGFEALLRWQHPERGLVPPNEFIPIAEETGLILPIGRWILREACLQMTEWNRLHPAGERLTVSVNLSGCQLGEADFVGKVVRILDETGLDPSQLELEITESAIMSDTETAIERLGQLRGLGIGLAIDDFGTGYSSLSYLHRLPLSALKIDRAFVWAMSAGSRELQICHGIVTLAHDLGLTVIAEGIETAEQRERLRALRCEYGQGYLFAKPVPAEAAGSMISERIRF